MKRVAIPNRLQGAAIDELIVKPYFYNELTKRTWRIWLHTADWKHGTYLLLHSDGMVERVTETEDDGVQTIVVKLANT